MDGDYLDTDLPHCSPSKSILPSPDDSSHALLSSIGYRSFPASDMSGGGSFNVHGRPGLGGEGDSFDDSVLTDDLSIRLGDSPASSSGDGLLGLIHAHAGGGTRGGGGGRRRSQASQRAAQVSPLVQSHGSNTTSCSSRSSSSNSSSYCNSISAGTIAGMVAPHQGGTPLPQPTPNPPLSTASVLPPPSSLVASTPAGKYVPFSSPAVLAKAKQANISPSMARGSCNCKKSKCLKLYVYDRMSLL